MARNLISDGTRIGIIDRNGKSVISAAEFQTRLDVDGWIRLSSSDYGQLSDWQEKLVHFNLGRTTNQAALRYAIVPIIERGWRNADGSEEPAYVSLTSYAVGICIDVEQRVALTEVTEDHFRHSLAGISGRRELEAALLMRYRPMFPDFSDGEILAQGCAITTLRLVEKVEV
ncbi:hypothetical protein [Rhizobium sp. BK376]|uniref:hypothetical protein n=1 Tax=Rhizobium sp. BK376 TaxID=2512149 RepID=UPI00104BE84C|nr:hypothetical protein [Rhizobium sp. BK376]TCR82273.1 hypothetical protein EV561_111178 [Rhizobium sp. BK376]